jgi:tryptophan synthase alpha chain
MTGIQRIQSAFAKAQNENRATFMPYHPMGYPDRDGALSAVRTLATAGADLFELGIPFSDPLADGPTIQAATYQALTQGTTVADCLAMARELRAEGLDQPFCAMTYYNPIYRYGLETFVADAVDAGVDGLIVPDLPPEEADELEALCRDAGIATIHFLAPTSTEARIKTVAARATGFIYLVSVTGITGARTELPPGLKALIERIRQYTDLPIAVGFGIATGEQAAAISAIADGVIVGSALVKAAGSEAGTVAVQALGEELVAGVRTGRA